MKATWLNRFMLLLIIGLGSMLTACAQVHTETTYADVAFSDRVAQADLIVVGKVTNISQTLWNQDSGEYWEETSADGSTLITGISYYTIDIEVNQSVVADVAAATVAVTAIGENTLVGEAASSEQNDQLKVGDEVVVFAQKSEMAWRENGTRSILQLMGIPNESYLIKGEDGLYHSVNSSVPAISLEDLIDDITEQRSVAGS